MTPGDRLFAYTDGIIDAPNPGGESFGLARLKDALDENTGASLSELKSAVLKTLHEFTEKELTHDDVTLIAMEIC
jgi:sigma-B regulation protein RsbU (phosphoserine phosphatase)